MKEVEMRAEISALLLKHQNELREVLSLLTSASISVKHFVLY